MPSPTPSYVPVTAFDYAKEFVKRMPLERVQARILDRACKYFWLAAPWRWSIASIATPTPLVSSTSDYTIADPGDLLYLEYAYVTDGSNPLRPLKILPHLPANIGQIGNPTGICLAAPTTVRLWPKPGTQPSVPPSIHIYYKKTAPSITLATIDTAGQAGFYDEWSWVFEDIVLWLSYLYADDQRAGSCQYDSQRRTYAYTGQRAVVESALQFAREREVMPNWEDEKPMTLPERTDTR